MPSALQLGLRQLGIERGRQGEHIGVDQLQLCLELGEIVAAERRLRLLDQLLQLERDVRIAGQVRLAGREAQLVGDAERQLRELDDKRDNGLDTAITSAAMTTSEIRRMLPPSRPAGPKKPVPRGRDTLAARGSKAA
ncbi:MAG: hypothetical protein DI623_11340 [Sphingomonas sanxanigenens]|uniref:Uncharacterized protein n=1 Tax=Sphingomonas sanxanigenens TaxID=397260 RepID=A0A2W5C179_9SPHN|nr:MAG: hypothetical protein DI623_11340 [Sphingomonas sanxanigenens]